VNSELAPTRKEQALATRLRILDAAHEEFQRHGFAGARVDRIAELAGSNKRLIYSHFGDKAGVFNAVLSANLAVVAEAVPFVADDLPDYAARLFDFWSAHPDRLRLFLWRNLEAPEQTPVQSFGDYGSWIEQIRDERPELDNTIPPDHLFAFLLVLASAWSAPADAQSLPSAAELAARRASVREAVRRLV
jgi:AcrR family transcriptional regulator